MYRTSYYTSSATSAENAELLKDPQVSYTIEYFDLTYLGAVARNVLAYSGLPWKNIFHKMTSNWYETTVTPFKCLPILHIHREGSPEVILSESMIIDMYLAGKAGLLGDNEWEEQVIKALYSNAHWAREHWWFEVTEFPTVQERLEKMPKFINGTLKKWIESIEYHHAQNAQRHTKGYLLGDKLSLADLMVAEVVANYETYPPSFAGPVLDVIHKSSALMKIKQLVDEDARLRSWHTSPECQRLTQNTVAHNKRRHGTEQ